jgi:hypothetical protein
MNLAGVVIGMVGLCILAVSAGWPIAFGVLMMLWGNNLEREHRRSKSDVRLP